MYRKDQLEDLMNHFQEYMLFTSTTMEKLVLAIEKEDTNIANDIYNVREQQANKYESQIEEESIKFLALNQAEATILRTLVMIIKMNNDLERICDNISNVSKSVINIINDHYSNENLKALIITMATKALIMLKDVNFAFLNKDVEMSHSIIYRDDEIDNLHSKIYKTTLSEIINAPDMTDSILRYHRMSKNIERACDIMTNMSEDIIFLISGKDVKHNS